MSLVDQLIDVIRGLVERVSALELQETPFEAGVLPLSAGGTGATSAAGALAAIGAAAASHVHSGADITSGTVAAARLGASPTATKLLFGDNTWATLAASDIPAHVHSGADITSGTVAAARLGSGTTNATTLLRGDGAWTNTLGGNFGLSAGNGYFVGGTQVLGSRRTGWSAWTGTATRSSRATASVTLVQLAEAFKALTDDLIAHGTIGS